MSKRILRLLMMLTAVAALGAGGVGLSAANTTRHVSGESSTESSAPENSAADPDNVQYTAPGDADYRGTAVARKSTRATRAAHRTRHSARHSTVRRTARRAQSTPDPTAPEPNEPSGETESSVETEQGQPGEPVNGHQDPPGQDVNHECTGDCVE
jgi:hypothetical protein